MLCVLAEKNVLRDCRAEVYSTEDPVIPLASSWLWESQGPECTEMGVRAGTPWSEVYLDPIWPELPTVPFQPGFSLWTEANTIRLCLKVLFPELSAAGSQQQPGCSDGSPALHSNTCPISYPKAEQALPGARAGIRPLALF